MIKVISHLVGGLCGLSAIFGLAGSHADRSSNRFLALRKIMRIG